MALAVSSFPSPYNGTRARSNSDTQSKPKLTLRSLFTRAASPGPSSALSPPRTLTSLFPARPQSPGPSRALFRSNSPGPNQSYAPSGPPVLSSLSPTQHGPLSGLPILPKRTTPNTSPSSPLPPSKIPRPSSPARGRSPVPVTSLCIGRPVISPKALLAAVPPTAPAPPRSPIHHVVPSESHVRPFTALQPRSRSVDLLKALPPLQPLPPPPPPPPEPKRRKQRPPSHRTFGTTRPTSSHRTTSTARPRNNNRNTASISTVPHVVPTPYSPMLSSPYSPSDSTSSPSSYITSHSRSETPSPEPTCYTPSPPPSPSPSYSPLHTRPRAYTHTFRNPSPGPPRLSLAFSASPTLDFTSSPSSSLPQTTTAATSPASGNAAHAMADESIPKMDQVSKVQRDAGVDSEAEWQKGSEMVLEMCLGTDTGVHGGNEFWGRDGEADSPVLPGDYESYLNTARGGVPDSAVLPADFEGFWAISGDGDDYEDYVEEMAREVGEGGGLGRAPSRKAAHHSFLDLGHKPNDDPEHEQKHEHHDKPPESEIEAEGENTDSHSSLALSLMVSLDLDIDLDLELSLASHSEPDEKEGEGRGEREDEGGELRPKLERDPLSFLELMHHAPSPSVSTAFPSSLVLPPMTEDNISVDGLPRREYEFTRDSIISSVKSTAYTRSSLTNTNRSLLTEDFANTRMSFALDSAEDDDGSIERSPMSPICFARITGPNSPLTLTPPSTPSDAQTVHAQNVNVVLGNSNVYTFPALYPASVRSRVGSVASSRDFFLGVDGDGEVDEGGSSGARTPKSTTPYTSSGSHAFSPTPRHNSYSPSIASGSGGNSLRSSVVYHSRSVTPDVYTTLPLVAAPTPAPAPPLTTPLLAALHSPHASRGWAPPSSWRGPAEISPSHSPSSQTQSQNQTPNPKQKGNTPPTIGKRFRSALPVLIRRPSPRAVIKSEPNINRAWSSGSNNKVDTSLSISRAPSRVDALFVGEDSVLERASSRLDMLDAQRAPSRAGLLGGMDTYEEKGASSRAPSRLEMLDGTVRSPSRAFTLGLDTRGSPGTEFNEGLGGRAGTDLSVSTSRRAAVSGRDVNEERNLSDVLPGLRKLKAVAWRR